eukprot:scaffold2807_cov336-Prasinococcus_capsulatus_cf.AAC.6
MRPPRRHLRRRMHVPRGSGAAAAACPAWQSPLVPTTRSTVPALPPSPFFSPLSEYVVLLAGSDDDEAARTLVRRHSRGGKRPGHTLGTPQRHRQPRAVLILTRLAKVSSATLLQREDALQERLWAQVMEPQEEPFTGNISWGGPLDRSVHFLLK